MTEELTNPHIVCAAIKQRNGLIVCGARHYDPIMRAVVEQMAGYFNGCEQGFIDQYGRFYSRKDAWVIADRNKQVVNDLGTYGTLYSEHLY